jgi:dienelactone hydrolase
MRRWQWVLVLGLIALAVIVLPVLIRQFNPPETRQFTGTRLDDLTYTEVSFRNEEQDIELAGMLFVPEGEGPFPGGVMIHGSGTSRRDSMWYLTFAEHLQRNGITVLLPDKRGSESSGGDWRTASLEDLATDTLAAVQYLRDQEHVPVAKVGVIGFSQGGRIAPIAASRSDDIAFVINAVGDAMPFHQTFLYEEDQNLQEMGVLPGISRAIAHLSTRYHRHIGQKEVWRAMGNQDPLPYWQQLTVPALVLYGADDTNVDSLRSAARLEGLDNNTIEIVIYEGSGHALEDPPGKGDRIVREEALERIVRFIEAETATAAS